jgi:aminoglycoside phosphotransferase (APT) family kinase protein
MHADEVPIDASLVKQLLKTQFPRWADLPIQAVKSAGTDNALYRLGDTMVVRLPRIHWAIDQIQKENQWLPKLASKLPFEIPTPLVIGMPDETYPWNWGIYKWIEGESATRENIEDLSDLAKELAHFIISLQKIDVTNGPAALDYDLRGALLSTRDVDTREAIISMKDMIDIDIAIKIWETSLHAPEWNNHPVWFHGDLLPGNILIKEGHLHAVIDFGGLGIGDPACDLLSAWGLFSGESRKVFRESLNVDDATWLRGRGHALSQAVIFIPYYLNTNPIGVTYMQHVLDEVFEDYFANKK